jgi:hypothetical protein
MKRVGELYEVVVFTASVSKVSVPLLMLNARLIPISMATLFSTNWTFTALCTIGFSVRVATTTRATTSRYDHRGNW